MADKNLISYNGPADNGRHVDHGSLVIDGSIPGISSALKFSTGLANFWLRAQEVRGGKDACVDINNVCRNLEIHAGRMFPTGQFAATIKGGTVGFSLYGELHSHGKVADIILGDWSDQSHAMTTGGVIGVTSKTGKPVRVLVLKAERPHFVQGTGPYVFCFPSPNLGPIIHPGIVFGFETLRRWGFFREQSNK